MKEFLVRCVRRLRDAVSPERRLARYDYPDAHRHDRTRRGQDGQIVHHHVPSGRNQGLG